MGRRILFLVPALFAVQVAQAQTTTGRVVGRATADGRPVPGVQIAVRGTARGAIADTTGSFTINGVPAGVRTVVARRIGYAEMTSTVTVVAGEDVTVNFTLTS